MQMNDELLLRSKAPNKITATLKFGSEYIAFVRSDRIAVGYST